MKFYYNGKLVRTSKTHEYKFGVLSAEGGMWSCHETREGAEKALRSYISPSETGLQECMNALDAIKNGRKCYKIKQGNRWVIVPLAKGNSNERLEAKYWEERAERNREYIARFSSMKIVELEARQ